MQRSGRPKQQFHAKQGSSELFSNRAGAAQQGSVPPPDDSQLAVRAYDEFPYDGYAFPLTHPERLGTLAILFGMHPEPAATARVIELGCGTGGNLIPMALSMPGATFTGYDLSGVQVELARETIATLGLRNIAVEQRNILDVGGGPDMDFIRNRTFRSTLLCHRERQLDRNVDSARLTRLYVAAGAESVDTKSDVRSAGQDKFRTLNGIEFQTAVPMTKAAIRTLAADWPRAISFGDLLASAQRIAGAPAAGDAGQGLAADLLQLYAANAVELHCIPSSFVTSVSDKPRTSALVRLQASQGERVTNLRHESLRVNDVERRILTLLDGSRGRQEVIEEFMAAVTAGGLSLKRADAPITDPADRLEQLGRFYDQLLPQFGKKALLVA